MANDDKGATPLNPVLSILDQRYKELTSKLKDETNIIIRYELKLKIEELIEIYKLLDL